MRNLKALGLALVAILAIGSMMATSAQAAPQFTAFNTDNGQHEGGVIWAPASSTQIFKSTASSSLALECLYVSMEAATASGTATSLTFTNIVYKHGAEGSTCRTNPLGLPVHVFMNNCHYEFTITKTLKKDEEYEGEAHIKCTGETKHITIEVTTSGGATKCTITIGEQTIGPIQYRNVLGFVTIESKAENVVNTTAGGVLNCGVANGEHKTGVYNGSVTALASNEEGRAIDSKITGE